MRQVREKEIADLVTQIKHHDKLYWERNAPEIPDADYDLLREKLKALDPENPVLLDIGERPAKTPKRKKEKDEPVRRMLEIIQESDPHKSSTSKADQAIFEAAKRVAHHFDRYWRDNTIEISNAAYDELRSSLKTQCADHLFFQHPRVTLKQNVLTATHNVPMLSIDKVVNPPGKQLNPEGVVGWAQDSGAFASESEDNGLTACYKVDGSSCSLIYQNGLLVQALTRGDGKTGNLITRNALEIDGIPHVLEGLQEGLKGRIEIRGEIYASRAAFARAEEEFERLLSAGIKTEKDRPNPRNYCAGSLILIDPTEFAERQLSFTAHGCVGTLPGANGVTEWSNFKAMSALGFQTPFCRHVARPSDVAAVVEAVDAERDALPYYIDGVVFTVNNLALHAELGFTSHHPRYKIAFKYGRDEGETNVTEIEWETSRSGRVCPTMIVDPIRLFGATVTRCTLHNARLVKETAVTKGNRVLLEREVIPKFVKKVSKPNGNEAILPSECPSCGAELIWDETKTNLMCPNLGGCKSQLQDYLEHYVSRKAANIDGIGAEIIQKLIEAGLLKSPADLYTLTEEKLLLIKKPSKEKSKRRENIFEKKLVRNIESSREQTLDRFLVALGIKGLGPSAAGKLAGHFGSIEKILAATPEQLLLAISKKGTKDSENKKEKRVSGDRIANGLKDRAELIAALLKHVKIKETPHSQIDAQSSGALSGKSFCLTGKVEFEFEGTKYTSRDEIEKLVVAYGGSIRSVTKKLDYLVAGDGGGGKRADAEKFGVRVIDADALLAMLERKQESSESLF
ncbi:MAG TPA: NAD-dependent DNA ligase LigA [Planctomycetota bacterium]|nr:NAD-dependent DNA ligase LigA [Planctomycetota bacterium]